jgi:hypothetical protein
MRQPLSLRTGDQQCASHMQGGFDTAPSDLSATLRDLVNDLWRTECRRYLVAVAVSHKRSHFIGGETNSEIEKSAVEAGHRDVRRPEQRRSGGNGSSSGDS